MSNTQTLIPASNVEGNVTSCKIENQVKTVKQDSVWSYQKHTTYITYDVCNKKVIAEYTKPELAGSGLLLWGAIVVLTMWLLIAILRAWIER